MSKYTTVSPVCVTDADEEATDEFFTLILDDTPDLTSEHDASCMCAWCLEEQGIVPDSNDSHGICSAHSASIYQAWKAGRA